MRSRARGQPRPEGSSKLRRRAAACFSLSRVALAALLLVAVLLLLVLWAASSALLRGTADLAAPHALLNGTLRMLSTGQSLVAKQGAGTIEPVLHGPMFEALRGARGCQHYSVWCARLESVLAAEARWRSQLGGQQRLRPWLQENGSILKAWLALGSREYAGSMAGAIATGGSDGLHEALLSTLHERQAQASPWLGLPMVAELHDAAVSEDGVVSAPVSGGRWGKHAEVVVFPSCGTAGLIAKPVDRAWCSSYSAPVVVIAQPMCFGPAHFLAECFPRLLVAVSAALHEGALVHVTEANAMVRSALDAVGLSSDRLVTGCVRAPKVLVPDGTFCGNPPASSLIPMRRWAWSLTGACKDLARRAIVEAAGRLLPVQASTDLPRGPSGGSWEVDAAGACPAGLMSLGTAAAALGPVGAVSAWGGGQAAAQLAATCVLAHPQAVGVVAPAPGPVRVLYVRRLGTRQIVNEDELLEALSQLEGVGQVTTFSPAGLKRDVAAFAAADVVLAPHGAGLANIVGCPPWAHVVELLAQPVNIMYGSMCARLGLKWHALTPAVASHSGVIQAEVGLVVERVREAASAIQDLAQRFGAFSESHHARCAA